MSRRRFAVVGIGGRSEMYTQAITTRYAEHCRLVALCDTNQARLEARKAEFPAGYPDVPLYGADQFARMIRRTKPDVVLVTTRNTSVEARLIMTARPLRSRSRQTPAHALRHLRTSTRRCNSVRRWFHRN